MADRLRDGIGIARDVMIIYLSQIGEDGRRFQGEESIDILELQQDPAIRFHGNIVCDVYAQIVAGNLIVQGSLAVDAERECSRCGEFFSTTVKDSSFLRDYVITPDMQEVDITEDIREAVMLQLGCFPLCSRECRGLCPHCGINLNLGICDCGKQDSGGSWGALEQLKLR